ncbi:hypothetical protein DOTSEDRAFT_71265 [Dothistroma septosporum NZE10]|uniref:Uncharacterized protein n=1 Tax=Dothistroma septosporum (strain NZE10 / CBS 128990) TaxID=675120 RepID=N1PSZ9_DOTSN|nr:hypothetical protein DOTSEDRAFT_71265 [Dothistroma septosporum NZE10]
MELHYNKQIIISLQGTCSSFWASSKLSLPDAAPHHPRAASVSMSVSSVVGGRPCRSHRPRAGWCAFAAERHTQIERERATRASLHLRLRLRLAPPRSAPLGPGRWRW